MLHAIIVVVLLWTAPKRELREPAPSTEVPVVFESSGGAPALPDPQLMESAPGDPDPAPPLPEMPDAPPTPGPPAPAPPQPTPEVPTPVPPVPMPPVPVPPQVTPEPPPPAAPPTPEPPQPEPPTPAPEEAPTPPPPAETLPVTPPPAAEALPTPLPPSDTAELVLPPPPPPPPPQEQAPRAAPTRPRSPFPGTLDLSRQPPMAFAPPPQPRGGVPRQALPPGALDLSMGRIPQQRSVPGQQNLNGNMSHVAGAQASGSWNGAFMAWVRNRSFYPRQAAMNGDDGEVMVELVIERSGRVRSVQLRRRSGSIFLDMGLQSIFRNQQVPPFTPDMEGETMTMNFTMRYILLYH